MVEMACKAGTAQCCLRPNHSMTWRQARYFLCLLAVVTLGVAVFWAVQGAWVILPLAGLELLLVVWLTRRVCARSYRQEVLEIDTDSIRLVWGGRAPEGCWQSDRHQTRLECWRPAHSLSAPDLLLRAGERSVSIARDCPKVDRECFIRFWAGLSLPVEYKGETRIHAHPGFERE